MMVMMMVEKGEIIRFPGEKGGFFLSLHITNHIHIGIAIVFTGF